MVLDARPVADASRRSAGDFVKRRVLLLLALGSVGPLLVPRVRFAAGSSREGVHVGEVSGTALGSPRNPSGPPPPLAGLTLILLPRSVTLLDGLERLRRQSRDSLAAYRSAVPEMRRLVEEAVAALTTAGQGASIHNATVDDEGRFGLGEIPTGDWILIGYRSVHVDRASHDRQKESGTFLPGSRLVGYDRVSVWLRPFAVEPGRPQVVELTDRNIWFEGVVESTVGRDREPNTVGGRRRSVR